MPATVTTSNVSTIDRLIVAAHRAAEDAVFIIQNFDEPEVTYKDANVVTRQLYAIGSRLISHSRQYVEGSEVLDKINAAGDVLDAAYLMLIDAGLVS